VILIEFIQIEVRKSTLTQHAYLNKLGEILHHTRTIAKWVEEVTLENHVWDVPDDLSNFVKESVSKLKVRQVPAAFTKQALMRSEEKRRSMSPRRDSNLRVVDDLKRS
jgi:hypothetical protein